MFKDRKRSDPEEHAYQREVTNSGGVSLNSDFSLLLNSETSPRYLFTLCFHLKYLVFVIIKKGEIVRTKFESTTLYLSFDDNKVKRYSIYMFHV